MSIQAMARVMDSSEAMATDRLVLLVMANRAGGDHDECFASVDRLSHECRLDARTIQRAIKRLIELGDLVFLGIHAKWRTNIYAVMPVSGVLPMAESHPGGGEYPLAPPKQKKQAVSSSGTKTSSLPTPSRAASRPRDLLADALARAEGADPFEVPASRMKTLCVKANELRKLNPNITPAEIAYRASNWSSHYERAAISGPAIVAHWGTLAHPGASGNGSVQDGSLLDRVKARLREN